MAKEEKSALVISDLPPPIERLIAQEMADTTHVELHLRQQVLGVTADRVRLCLRDYRDKYEQRLRLRVSWQTPAGILVSLLAALVASDFKEMWPGAATWRALFILVAVLCAGFLVRGLFRAYRAWPRAGDHTDEIDALLECFKR